jgi:DnaJ-class molecular chaperone
MADDHYQTLGVPRTASADEIRKAYRELARKYHPDLHPDDDAAKEQFKRVQTAFDVLNDPGKREMYDRYGSTFEGAQGAGGRRAERGPFAGGGFPGGEGGGFNTGEIDLESLFGGGFADLFGGQGAAPGGGGGSKSRSRRRATQTTGEDLKSALVVLFKLAIEGGKSDLRVDRGGGAETISVTIPQGIADGAKMRLRGQGMPGAGGGPAGDLLLEVKVDPHPLYRRDGDTLTVPLPVSLSEALSGAKVDLPTPWGTISLRVPPLTSSGRRLRAAGMGVRRADGTRGDLIAEVQVMLPEGADAAAVERLREAAAGAEPAGGSGPRSRLQW